MTYNEFETILKEMGFDSAQISELNDLGYESAADAHAGAENDIENFEDYCYHIGREFVIENLEMFI